MFFWRNRAGMINIHALCVISCWTLLRYTLADFVNDLVKRVAHELGVPSVDREPITDNTFNIWGPRIADARAADSASLFPPPSARVGVELQPEDQDAAGEPGLRVDVGDTGGSIALTDALAGRLRYHVSAYIHAPRTGCLWVCLDRWWQSEITKTDGFRLFFLFRINSFVHLC